MEAAAQAARLRLATLDGAQSFLFLLAIERFGSTVCVRLHGCGVSMLGKSVKVSR